MPYVFAFVILIVAAGALLLFRQPAEVPATANTEPAVEEADQMQPESQNNVPEGFTPPASPPPSTATDEQATAAETDGAAATETYNGEASYFTPNRTEHDVLVTLELDGETVVDANVTYNGESAQTPNHTNFDNAYTEAVIGQNINELQLSRVGGASLTSNAFNDAVTEIKGQL
jgi:hypothetical protein